MINVVLLTIISLVIFGLLVGFIVYGLKERASGFKIMLFGISITLFGGIIAIDPDFNLGGIEYLIALSGLIISLIGLIKKD